MEGPVSPGEGILDVDVLEWDNSTTVTAGDKPAAGEKPAAAAGERPAATAGGKPAAAAGDKPAAAAGDKPAAADKPVWGDSAPVRDYSTAVSEGIMSGHERMLGYSLMSLMLGIGAYRCLLAVVSLMLDIGAYRCLLAVVSVMLGIGAYRCLLVSPPVRKTAYCCDLAATAQKTARRGGSLCVDLPGFPRLSTRIGRVEVVGHLVGLL